ncbi:MAG TPA: nuclear transport factor 2 family protein [Bacteroidetes bacterium]|nr:nuclear transport factor 2 family protein [Bacteroidota bacterium]HIL57345.1 nuclear transport factor 2 family protein [Rhodothermales bacterium]
MSLREQVDDLNNRILQGDILGAFEDYYADDVVMIDAGQPPREGKDANRVYEEAFVGGLTEFRGAEVKAVGIDESAGKALVEWHFDFSHKDYGDQTYDQVAVQTWKDGQIVEERFYKL